MFSPQVQNRSVIGNNQRCSDIPTKVLTAKVGPPSTLFISSRTSAPRAGCSLELDVGLPSWLPTSAFAVGRSAHPAGSLHRESGKRNSSGLEYVINSDEVWLVAA